MWSSFDTSSAENTEVRALKEVAWDKPAGISSNNATRSSATRAIPLRLLDVVLGSHNPEPRFFFIHFTHDRRRMTSNKRSRRHHHPRRHERSGCNDRPFTNHRVVQNDAAHPNETTITHGASVQDHPVPNRHVYPNDRDRYALGQMHARKILHVCPGTDTNLSNVAAKHAAKPHAGTIPELDVTHERRVWRNERVTPKSRGKTTIRKNERHRSPSGLFR